MLDNLSDMHGTLEPPISSKDWSTAVRQSDAASSLPLRLFYARHNGQRQLMREDILLGMFGGYSVYDQRVCSVMLQLGQALVFAGEQLPEVARSNPHLGISELDKAYGHYVMFGASLQTAAVKHLLLYDCTTDQVKVCDLGVPDSIGAAAPVGCGLIGWFEEFAGRLSGGVFSAGRLSPMMRNVGKSVVQFPCSGPEMTVEVTRGVQCTASPVAMGGSQGWAYSIRVRLLGPEHGWTAERRGFESCQLITRRWQIFNKGTGQTETVEGEGVIGFYPLLEETRHRPDMQGEEADWFDEPTFVYQSCSGRSKGGTFGGTLRFVPGSIRAPTGPEFDVVVKTFTLERPKFIF
jgi:F-box protein 3